MVWRVRRGSVAGLLAIAHTAAAAAPARGEVGDSDHAPAPPPPSHAPPPLVDVTRDDHGPPAHDRGAPTDPSPGVAPPRPRAELAAHAQWHWSYEKAMPGLGFSAGRRWLWVNAETAFIWTTADTDDPRAPFLGSLFGFYVMASPFDRERFEVRFGLGADLYALYGVNGDAVEVAMSTKAEVVWWFVPKFGAYVGLRAYPASSGGVQLGRHADGDIGFPIMITTGVSWRNR